MSRSLWAAAGAWSPATAGRGAVSQQRLEDGRLERGRLLSVAHLSRALLSVAAAAVLALALEPASARAQRVAVTSLALAGTHAKPGARGSGRKICACEPDRRPAVGAG